jgi:hypothetical protein
MPNLLLQSLIQPESDPQGMELQVSCSQPHVQGTPKSRKKQATIPERVVVMPHLPGQGRQNQHLDSITTCLLLAGSNVVVL